jgi:hypothetical protein
MKFVTGRKVIAPMDFDYSPEDEAFRRELRTWRYCRAVTRLFALSTNER